MEFDIFFSISQTPDSSGFVPSEREMFYNFQIRRSMPICLDLELVG